MRSRERFFQVVVTAAYLVIWAVFIGFFWTGDRQNALGYSLVSFCLILPVVAVTLSFFIGRDDGCTGTRWVMLPFFGLM